MSLDAEIASRIHHESAVNEINFYGNKIVCTDVFDLMNKKLQRDGQDGLGLFSITLQRCKILRNSVAIVPSGLGGLSTAGFLF